jgi:hypothetical protein
VRSSQRALAPTHPRPAHTPAPPVVVWCGGPPHHTTHTPSRASPHPAQHTHTHTQMHTPTLRRGYTSPARTSSSGISLGSVSAAAISMRSVTTPVRPRYAPRARPCAHPHAHTPTRPHAHTHTHTHTHARQVVRVCACRGGSRTPQRAAGLCSAHREDVHVVCLAHGLARARVVHLHGRLRAAGRKHTACGRDSAHSTVTHSHVDGALQARQPAAAARPLAPPHLARAGAPPRLCTPSCWWGWT